MKNLFLLLLVSTLPSPVANPVELNVMSYNIRYDNPQDGLNDWQHRKEVAAQIIRDRDIDIVGAQEVLAHQLDDLKARLPGYTALGVGRTDGKQAGEYAPLLFKSSRFSAIESGSFWLSQTPEIIGSKGWDADLERVATWAILKDKDSGRDFFVLNTHFDHMGEEARRESARLLQAKSTELSKGLPVLITGDFNAEPDSEAIAALTASGRLIDSRSAARVVKGPAYTFHDFGKKPTQERPLIDYLFVDGAAEVLEYEVLPEKLNGIYLSDHAPVSVKLKLR